MFCNFDTAGRIGNAHTQTSQPKKEELILLLAVISESTSKKIQSIATPKEIIHSNTLKMYASSRYLWLDGLVWSALPVSRRTFVEVPFPWTSFKSCLINSPLTELPLMSSQSCLMYSFSLLNPAGLQTSKTYFPHLVLQFSRYILVLLSLQSSWNWQRWTENKAAWVFCSARFQAKKWCLLRTVNTGTFPQSISKLEGKSHW